MLAQVDTAADAPLAVTRPMHIFVAEDGDDDLLLIQEAIASYDTAAVVHVARDGMAAVELLLDLSRSSKTPLDLAFFDINMPIRNGLEALQMVRQEIDFATLPVVIFTSSDQREDINLAYRSGANAFVQKPSEYNQLVVTIHCILRFFQQTEAGKRLGKFATS